MKKLLFTLFLTVICSTTGFAQTSAIFYGVDYSFVKVRGADESHAAFVQAFERINDLFISQGEKFNVAKYTRQPITGLHIEVAKRATNTALDAISTGGQTLLTTDANYDCREQIDAQIANYELPQKEGTGVVIIANLLDKSNDRGSYYFVYFDITSRKVNSCIQTEGKPGGFGLRNYWANSLYLAMKKYYKHK